MGRRAQQHQLFRIVKLVGLLLVVAFFVVLLVRDAPGIAGLSQGGVCGGTNGFFATAVPWLSSAVGRVDGAKDDVKVCVLGKYDLATLPSEVTCALPKATFVVDKQQCNVWYSDVKQLNSYQTDRRVEANVLRLPSGVMLLQKSNPYTVLTGRDREVTLRSGEEVLYAAIGEPSALDVGLKCKIRQTREPDDFDPAIYVMTYASDSVFFNAAKSYARARGYGFLVPGSSCTEALKHLPLSWRKLALLKLALSRGKKNKKQQDGWILWLDPLALVTNTDFQLETLISGPMGKVGTLMVGQDAQPPYLLNVGVLLAKISPQSIDVIESIWQCGRMKGWTGQETYYWDQNALTHLTERGMVYSEFGYWLNSIRLLPHRVLSSFMRQDRSSVERDLGSGHWRVGDFVALMTGVDAKEATRQAVMLQALKAGDTVRWLDATYNYPQRKVVPPMYSVRLDTYLFVEKPTWLFFKTEAAGRHTLNPSCVWWGHGNAYDRVWCVVRTINYNLNLELGYYEWPDVGRTINQFFELSAEEYLHSPGKTIEVPSTMEMYVPVPILSKMVPMRTEGFEDVKMIRIGDKLYGICTCLQMNPRQNCEIVLLTIRDNQVMEALPLRGYRDNDCHKNWMPFELNGELHLIEQVDPIVVLKPDVVEGRANVLFEDKTQLYPNLRLRGTSNGIKFAAGHLFMIHETITRGKEYAHRFMYLESGTKGWKRRLSRPFFVVRKTVEFVIGLRMTKDESTLILGLGFEDVKAAFQQVKIKSPQHFLDTPFLWMEHD
jgi:hypothetical protein